MERIIIDQERLFDIYALDDHGFDPISMYILLNHLPEDYKPSGKTLAMVIGHSAQKYDGVLIRTLHQHRSGINKKDLAVVACDISEREPEDLTPEVYNLEIFGERRGNAAKFAPWSIGLNAA
ncbi:MAG: hypothetical protein KKE20_01400 [Nanoarchaeota archaeon]|nr:hypothetical protein [Nanoarchaeota archaeon]